MDEKKVQELWLAFKDGNELGSLQEFKSFMSDPKNRADFHSAFKANAELGDINQFEDYLGVKKKPSSQGSLVNWETGSIDVQKLSSTQPVARTAAKGSDLALDSLRKTLADEQYRQDTSVETVQDFQSQTREQKALASIRERRGTDYSSSAADMAKGRIDAAAKPSSTPLESLHSAASQMSFGDWLDESTPSYNTDQRTAAEFNAFSKSLSDENREIGLAIKGIESKMKADYGADMEDYGAMVAQFNAFQVNAKKLVDGFDKLPDNKKTQQEADRINAEVEKIQEQAAEVQGKLDEFSSTPEFNEISKLYDLSNINTKKYEDELKTGKYDHAQQFGKYLEYRQTLKDESYKKMNSFEKAVSATGTVILHSLAKVPQSVASLTDVVEKSVGLEGETRGAGDVLQDIFIGLGDDIQAAFPAPTKLQRGGFTNTAKWGDYQVDFTADGDIQAIRDKDGYLQKSMLSEQQQAEIMALKKERQFNSQSFFFQTASTITDVGIQMLGTKGIGGIKAGVALTGGIVGDGITVGLKMAPLGTKVGATATVAGMMANDLYKEGLANFDGPDIEEKAARYALSTGVTIGLINSVLGLGVESQFLKMNGILSVPLAGLSKNVEKAIGQRATNIAKGILGEEAEEIVLEKIGQAGVQYMMNETSGGKFDIHPYKDVSAIMSEALTTAVAGGIFGGLKKLKEQPNSMQQSLLMDGSRNIPATIEAVRVIAEANGEPITPEVEAELTRRLEITAGAISRTPEEHQGDMVVIGLVSEQVEIEEENKALQEKIKGLAPAFQQDAKNDIAALEVKSAELALQVAEKAGVTPDEKAVKLLEPKEGEQKPVSATGNNDALRGFNIMGRNFGLDKPSRSDYEEGEAGDKKYAEDNINHNKSVDNAILGIKEDGILTDSEGNEYIVTQTSQGARVVNRLADGTEGSDISYRNGKRVSASTPFTNGFTFKPNREQVASQPTAPQVEPTASQQQDSPIPQETAAQGSISPSEPIASEMAQEAVNKVAAEEEGDTSSPSVGKRLRGFYSNSLKKMGGATPGQGVLAKIAKTDPQFYEPMSRSGNAQAVANEIDSDGLDTVVQRAMMDNTGEPEGVVAARRIVSLIAIGDAMADANRANDTQALDIMRNQAKELERLLGKKGTEFGQALSMYAIYSQTPEGQLAARLRDVEEKRERARTRMTEGGRQVGDVVDSIVGEVAKELKLTKEEVVAGLKESITVRNAIIRATKERKQAEKQLGEALRAIGKSILGKAGALPSVDIALVKKAFVAIKKLVKNSVTEARIKLSPELKKLGVDPEAALVELETKFPELFVEKNNNDIEKAVKKAAKKESGVTEMTQEELLVEMKRLAKKAREQMEAEKKAARDKVTVLAALMESKKGLDKKSKEQAFVKDKAEAVEEASIKIEKDKIAAEKRAEQSAREATIRKSIADSKKKAVQAEDRYKTIDKVIKALSQKEKSQEKKITEAQEILRGIKEGVGVFIDEKMIEASMENIDPTLPANEIAAKIAAQFNMTKAMEIAIVKTIEKTIGDKVVKAKASRLKQIVRTHVKSAKKARVIENGLLEAITIGGLNDDVIRRKLEEKYGIKSFTNEQITELNQMVMDMKDMPSRGQKFKQMREMMDYIHLHGGIDITSFFAATWYAKVLFSVKTMLSVTVGNEVNFWDNFVTHGLATEGGLYAMKESVKRVLQPITSRVGLAEKPYQDRGVWFGLAEGWRFIKTGEASREMKKVARSADLELVSRMSFTEAARDAMTSFANISNIFADVKNADSFKEGMRAAMGIISQLGTTGYLTAKAFAIPHSRVFKYSLRAISAADSLRYYSMLDFTLDRKAYNSAVAEGLDGRAAEARAKEIIGETLQESKAIYDQAVQEFTEYAAQRGKQLNEMFTEVDIAYRAREISEERLDESWRRNMERDASLQGQFDDAVQKVMDSNPGISQVDAEKTARRIRQRYYDNQLSPTEQARFEAEKVALQNDPQGVMGKLAKLLSADFPAVFDEAINAPEPEQTGDKKVDELNEARAKAKKNMAKVFKTYSSFMFPFMKTMANVVNMKIERFPVLGGVMKGVDAMFGVPSIDWNNQEQRRVFIARQVAGNIILLSTLAYIKSMEDDDEPVITLTGPKDFAKKQGEMETKAWKKETITVGGKRFYFGDTPYAAVLGFMGVREDKLAYVKEGEDDWTTGTMTMALLTQMFTNASYMQTFSNLSTAMQEQDAAKFGAALASPVSGMASSGLQRDLDRWMSPELRDRATIENRFVGEMLSRTPFAANYLLDFRYNSIGEAINPYENESFFTQAIGLDKYISSTEVSNPIFEVLADKKVRFKGIGKSIDILGTDATYQEKRDYTLFVGRYRNKILSANLQAMKDMGQEQLEMQLDKTDSEAKRAAELFVLLQRKNKAKADEGQIKDVSISEIDRFINDYDPEMVKQDSKMFMEELRTEKPESEVDESLFF